MNAVVLEKPHYLRFVRSAEPTPKPGETLVRVRRIGVCGTDLHAYRGNQPFFSYPRILGHELAVETDDGTAYVVLPYLECGVCSACRVGKTNCCEQLQVLGVHCDGGMGERIAVPTDHLIPAPGLSLDEMALVENQSIGAHAVRRADLQPGEWALVVGAGPIGMGVVQLAKAAGAQVIVMDLDENRLAFCRDTLGADHLVHGSDNPKDRLRSITGGSLPTAVFEATGNPKSMMAAFGYTAHGGRLIFVSIVQADITFSDPDFHRRELTLLSSRNATKTDFETVIRALSDGTITVRPMITHRARLKDAPDLFPTWIDRNEGVIKAMIEV